MEWKDPFVVNLLTWYQPKNPKSFRSFSPPTSSRRPPLAAVAPTPSPLPWRHLLSPTPTPTSWAQASAIQNVRTLVPVILDFMSNVFPKWRTFCTIAVTT